MHFIISPFLFLQAPNGRQLPWSRARSLANVMSARAFLGACVFFSAEDPPEDRGRARPSHRRYPSELGVTLEDGCSPVAHTLTQDGSKALLLSSGSQ